MILGGIDMWDKLDKPWQEAFTMAWEAYRDGTIPIGCVIVNKEGEIISKGRNKIYDKDGDNPFRGTNMAHAEMNTLLGIREENHPEIREYTLYSTMEPCPMCFGTIVMMSIRNVYYAARDAVAGATALNDKLDYIKNKNISVKSDYGEKEAFQLILQSSYEFERKHPRVQWLVGKWRKDNNLAIEIGEELYRSKYFQDAAKDNLPIEQIYNEVIGKYIGMKTCPLCGNDNNCSSSKECWCHSIIVPKELLDKVPNEKKDKSCICKTCIDDFKSNNN